MPGRGRNSRRKSKAKSLLFYCLLMIWPVAQFLIFYVGVNVRSFVIAFQNPDTGAFSLEFFRAIFGVNWHTILLTTRMSLLTYLISLVVGVPLGIVFAYYIYKHYFGSGFFRIVLYVPSILSTVVMVTLYYYFMTGEGSKWLFHGNNPFLDTHYQFWVLAFFNVFISFGNSVIMYTNRMVNISKEVIEAGRMDGAGPFREFWSIVLPEAYSTIEVFLVTGVATIFTNQWCLYLFYSAGGLDPSVQTLGYYLFRGVSGATEAELGGWSALGLLMSAVAIPLTFLLRYLLKRLGPDYQKKARIRA